MKNTITVEQQSANAIKWLEALLSGKYKQRFHYLGDEESGFCCWGVGCLVTGVYFQPENAWNFALNNEIGYDCSGGDLRVPLKGYMSLGDANDSKECTFEEIANHLITHAHLHFLSGVAEAITNHFQKS